MEDVCRHSLRVVVAEEGEGASEGDGSACIPVPHFAKVEVST